MKKKITKNEPPKFIYIYIYINRDMAYRSLYTCLRLLPLQQLKARTLSPPILSYQISELAPLPSTIAGAKTIKSFWDCGGGNGGSSGQSITLRCEYLIDPTDPRCRSQPIPIQSSGSGGTVVGSPGLPRSLSRLQSIGGQSPPLGSWHLCPPLPLFVILIIISSIFFCGKSRILIGCSKPRHGMGR